MSGPETASGRHAFVEHTGEVEVELEAPTLPGLFAEAARALAELMLEDARAAAGRESVRRRVAVRAPDRAALLVEWLNELVFRAETEKAVFTSVAIERVSDREVVAEIAGIAEPVIKTAVKAATLHRAEVTEDARGLRARVVLDV